MRTYPCNSPEAAARVLALALVADGRLDTAELAMLRKVQAFDRIGLSEEAFLEVLHDFCRDLLADGAASGGAGRIAAEDLLAMLDDLDDPHRRKTVLRLMLDVIRADGKLHRAESLLFWQAIEHWKLRLEEVMRAGSRGFRRVQPSPGSPKPRLHGPRRVALATGLGI